MKRFLKKFKKIIDIISFIFLFIIYFGISTYFFIKLSDYSLIEKVEKKL